MRELCRRAIVLAFPDCVSGEDISALEALAQQDLPWPVWFLRYQVKEGHDPTDLGIARITSFMHDEEIETVGRMAAGGHLDDEHVLVIDGPLRFQKRLDLFQFRNVIGLSKTFRPSVTVGKRKKDVGLLTAELEQASRTAAYRTDDDDKVIGLWYLRLRDPGRMASPLQGIVKVECYAVTDDERENGLDRARIDGLSSCLLRERNVTPYQADPRWASHIYPIYMTEAYIKSAYLSDMHFLGLF